MRRRVTYSRNFTVSLSRTCVSHCKYCAFQTHQAHLHEPAAVLEMLDTAVKRRAKELLVLTGDRPDEHPGVAERLAALGFATFLEYVVWVCERGLEHGLLPHTNLGAVTRDELVSLRRVTASQGLMLESLRPDLVAHQGSPTKDPELRLATIRDAGALRIPFTSGVLLGIGEDQADRVLALRALGEVHAEYGHLQEVILQNYVPHRRYHGEEPAQIATDAAEQYWRTGLGDPPSHQTPPWASTVSLGELVELIDLCSEVLPGVGVQIPPNLGEFWPALIAAGATDLGGLSANGDHISPEHPFPSPQLVRERLRADGVDGVLAERLCVYGSYLTDEWVDPAVLDVVTERYPTFLPRGGRAPISVRRDLIAGAIARGRDGDGLSADEITALFCETRLEAIEDLRQAADELRTELVGDDVTFVVNRNINVSNICTVGCAFCGFARAHRSPEAYEHSRADFVARIEDARAFGATELCLQSGIHPDWGIEDYLGWLRLARDTAPELHLHAYSPMEIAHMADASGLGLDAVFAALRDAGLGSTPGTAAEVLDDGVRSRISPNKLPVARWVEVIEASHRAGLRSTSTVMFGHIEEPWELAEHMRVVRSVQERTGGITEFVPLSFVPHDTRLGRVHGLEELSLEENLKHTAVFRLALGRAIPNLQASWVKMGLDAATEALRWGVNDLGGTLMEESISRMAGSRHGVRRNPEQLVAAAHRAGRPAVERTTLYAPRVRYPLAVAA